MQPRRAIDRASRSAGSDLALRFSVQQNYDGRMTKQAKPKRGRGAPSRAKVASKISVAFRATDAEHKRYSRAADAKGLTLSAWLRALADGASQPTMKGTPR